MSDDALPTDMLVGAQIRTAARSGIPVLVRRRGHNGSGTILLKIDLLNGTSHVLSQVRVEEAKVWAAVSKIDPMPEADAERYLARQIEIDPDMWVIEIEDREGRHWFPGDRITF
jgi:hypothetical protein